MYNTATAVEGKVRPIGDQAFRRLRTMTKRAWLLFGLGASLACREILQRREADASRMSVWREFDCADEM
jgi:hypothetical protein